jgi:hypothetical protein
LATSEVVSTALAVHPPSSEISTVGPAIRVGMAHHEEEAAALVDMTMTGTQSGQDIEPTMDTALEIMAQEKRGLV